jgi:hypothetical protein
MAVQFVALALAGNFLASAGAQNEASAPADGSPTAKWLAEQNPQWQAAYNHDVKDAFDKGVAELNKQYQAAVEKLIAQAASSGDLDKAVRYRAERDRIAAAGASPLEDGPKLPPDIEALHASYRRSLAPLEADRAERAKKLLARYDAVLSQSLVALTKAQRFDEALLIKAKREEIAAAWSKGTTGLAATQPPAPPAPASPTTTLPATAPKLGDASPRALVARLLAMGAVVRAPEPIKSADELPSDDYLIKSVDFSKSISEQAVAAVIGLKVAMISLRGDSAGKLSLDEWQQLGQSPTLKKVDLVGAPKTGVFSRLAKVQTLEEINMSLENGPAHKDSDIAALGALPNLRFLRMAKSPMNGTAFEKWPAKRPLKTLEVPLSADFSESSLQALLTAAPELSELSVGALSFNEEKAKILAQFASLKTLRVAKETPAATLKKFQEALPKAKVELRKDNRF